MRTLVILWLLGILLFHGSIPILAVSRPETAVIALVPEIPEAASQAPAQRVFFTNTVVITTTAVQAMLASTADGRGTLCTDDQATLMIQASTGQIITWTRRYTSTDRQRIVCQDPQRIQLPGRAGAYTVTITLEDVFAPKYGSQPYFMILDELPTAPSAITHAIATAPTLALPASLHAATTVPLPTLSLPLVTAETVLYPSPNVDIVTGQASIWVIGLSSATLAVVLLLLHTRRQRRQAPRLHGIVDLIDEETGEARTLLLSSYARGAVIVRQPLDVIPWPLPDSTHTALAVIIPKKHGPMLTPWAVDQSATSVLLQPGDRVQLEQKVELCYRL